MDLSTVLRKLQRSIASFAVVAIVASLSIASAVSAFSDVKSDAWYYSNVADLVDAGIVDGAAAKFNPASNLNRAEAAKIVVKAAGVEDADLVSPATPSFKDVKSSDWFFKYVETAKSLGFVAGNPDGTFAPARNVNRAEFAKMMTLALELEASAIVAPFSDVKSADWFFGAVNTAYHWSVVDGEAGKFNPARFINRAEMSKMVVAAMAGEERKTTPDGGTTPPPAAAGKLNVSLASNNPLGTSVISGQAIADLAHFSFANADSKESKITSLKLKRLGVSSDTTLQKVYLYDGNTRLSDEATVSSGVITFNNASGIFTVPASGSRNIAVKANIKDNVSGELVAVGITAAEDVVSTGTVAGNFPLNGNQFNVASATLATVSFTNSAGTTPSTNSALDPQLDYTVWQNSVTISNRAVNLKSVTFRDIGSLAVADISNFKLFIDGVQVGAAVAQQDANGYITFDLGASPKKLDTGVRTFKVQADVVGGSSKNFTISLRQAADVNVTDSEYNASILVKVGGSTFSAVEAGQQTVSSGTLTITKRSDSPSGTVVNNGSGVLLARYDLKAFGEAMKLESLRVSVETTGPVDGNTAASQIGKLRNGALYVNGVQVGSTSDIAGADSTADYTEFTLGSSVVVAPGTPKILEVRADAYDNDGTNNVIAGTTLKAIIEAGSTNEQKMVSGGYNANVAVTDANTLTVATGSLSVSADQSYGSQTTVVPSSAFLLGKFSATGGSTEDINLNTIRADFTFSNSDFASADLTNVYIKYGTKTSAMKATIASAAAGATSSNTWSISELLSKNASMTFEVYGDIASSAVVNAAADTVTTKLSVTGTTSSSGTTVYGSANGTDATPVSGQVVAASAGGNLTVTLDNGTPVSSIAVAGSTSTDGSVKVKLTASNEDLYIKDITFRVDTQANDLVVASAGLWKAEGSASFVQVLTDKSLIGDGSTNPGYVRWTLLGTDRIKVPKDGSTYLLLKPTYVASNQATITGQTPRIALADLQAEGINVLTPVDSNGSDLIVESGILIGGATPTFAADGTAVALGDDITAAAQTITSGPDVPGVNAAPTTDRTGSYAFIDQNDDATYDAGEEIIYVMEGSTGDATLIVQRGVFGTTAAAAEDGDKMYFLTGVEGNATTVLKTKLGLGVASDSPQGTSTGGSQKVIFKFTASAANNAMDPAENKVVLTSVAVTTNKSGLTVQNVSVYPSEFDQNASYKTTCSALSQSKWACTLATTGGTNEVVENTSRTYIVRADVGSGAGTTNSLDVNIASLGSASAAGVVTAGDVAWTDNTTSKSWVNQAGATYIQPASPLVLGANSGTTDSTGPTISSVVIGGTADNKFTVGDTVVITWNEMVDPTTINASLTPGGSVAGVTGFFARTIANPSLSTVPNIFNAGALVIGGNTGASGDQASSTVTLALNSADTVLTITVTAAGALNGGAVAESLGASTPTTTVIKDVNGNAATNTAVTPSGDL